MLIVSKIKYKKYEFKHLPMNSGDCLCFINLWYSILKDDKFKLIYDLGKS